MCNGGLSVSVTMSKWNVPAGLLSRGVDANRAGAHTAPQDNRPAPPPERRRVRYAICGIVAMGLHGLARDAAIADTMRLLLHDTAFQRLEATWRGVQWLLAGTGETCRWCPTKIETPFGSFPTQVRADRCALI